MNEENTILSNLKSKCSNEDGGKSKEVKEEHIEKQDPPQNLSTKIFPFPRRLEKRNDDAKFQKFLFIFNSLTINIPLVKDLTKIPAYANFMK